jgi:valyl-tRNA synthetase
MGCSCDWERTRFTLDRGLRPGRPHDLLQPVQRQLIFRGKRLVNWDTHLRTAVADDEIYYEDVQGQLWTIKYPVAGSPDGEALHVGDDPPRDDARRHGGRRPPRGRSLQAPDRQTIALPLTGREIPIIADAILVDPKFGTGCVKVTPAHDPNDYQTGLRHKLPMINLLNPDGTYNEEAGAYAGLPSKVVRKRVVADLEAQGLLAKVEPYATR